MGNGAKKQMKQQRNAAKNKKSNKGASTKSKEFKAFSATNICQICRQSFPGTAKEATLRDHVEGKHSSKKNKKSFQECFPCYGQGMDAPKDEDKNKKKKRKTKSNHISSSTA